MSCCATQDLVIRIGSTFQRVVRWESTPFVSKAITGITKTVPAVVTAVAHGVPDGWRVAVVSAGGMTEINSSTYPPKQSDFHKATVLSSSTVELNDVNSAEYTTYTSGGYLVYYTPVDLSGYTARMQIRETPSSADVILSLTTENGGITIDNTAKTISILISADDTADLDISTGVYDLELVSSTDVVTKLLGGSVLIEAEVTR